LCISIGAFAAGLTIGTSSIDEKELITERDKHKVKMKKDLESEVTDEKRLKGLNDLMDILKDAHLLLVTLLLFNSLANESLPLFLDQMFGPLGAVIVSVTVVLIFGEIIPSAFFSDDKKKITLSLKLVPAIKCLRFIF
jgi:CBS domain containing-hemolysin-like protein